MATQRQYKLVTVNNAPDRARKIVGRVIDDVKGTYNIVHAANAESPEAAKAVFEDVMPDVVVCRQHNDVFIPINADLNSSLPRCGRPSRAQRCLRKPER
ncbi:hypothetical protein LTS14_005900 [Recurvomyces mirabilis]|uniref:uncharacterized protein n=1 Tax=Recurvomyces mirabilis TaxID=574656 RepID=UPI002DDF85BA|nr:hypothetical protein LTS14_005900 [Recurvomyces mirabilis]